MDYPLIEMLAYFSRTAALGQPVWRKQYVHKLKRIRSCHSKVDGGVKKSFYSVETKQGSLIQLVFDEEQLLWTLEPSDAYPHHMVDGMLAWVKRHKHLPSRAHRVIPYRFEIIPEEKINTPGDTLPSLDKRIQPYRFLLNKNTSIQVTGVETRHIENVMITKHLHYVVQTDSGRFFHLVYILDQTDWRFMQEVDEELFFFR